MNIDRKSALALLEKLCNAFGPSGCEGNVADIIRAEISDCCDEIKTDRLGNVIAKIRGGKSGAKIMICAHMDEVGFMVNEITDEGYLKFSLLGGINSSVLGARPVTVGDEERKTRGIILAKAIHHKKAEDRLKTVKIEDMYVDIGATDKKEAEKEVRVGDFGTFSPDFYRFGKDGAFIKSKALDDRAGCAVMIEVMREIYPERGKISGELYFCFTVREEVGLSGAKTAAQSILPDLAIVLESTAVADIAGVDKNSRVADLGVGGAVSLMDNSTLYDRAFCDLALKTAAENKIAVQVKRYVSGGNDAGHIHKSGYGVRTLALSP